MISFIPELPDLHLEKDIKMEPILKQIYIQNEEILENVKPCNKRLVRIIITEYGMSKIAFMDNLFKKYENNYQELRTELQNFMNERKFYLETAAKNLK